MVACGFDCFPAGSLNPLGVMAEGVFPFNTIAIMTYIDRKYYISPEGISYTVKNSSTPSCTRTDLVLISKSSRIFQKTRRIFQSRRIFRTLGFSRIF